ncbi:MAG TPA: nuclear transport factor 2 family protein [Verrucomicrobiales bacterium]|nr:nuclear transport factor 2 family protein [Verrucomicrobiales bacterium]
MKQVFVITGLICLALCPEPCIGQDGKETERREKLLAVRDAWQVAFYAGDTDALDKVEAEEFLVIGDRVIHTKEEQLKGIKQAVEDKTWFPKGTKAVTEDLRVRFEGNVAVVTGRVKHLGQKDPPNGRIALTEVWVQRDGRWTVLHLHFHHLAPPPDEPKK